jgi:hypothetical protein
MPIFLRTPIFFRAEPNFSVCTRKPIFFHTMSFFTAQCQILACAPARQYFSQDHKLFTAHHAFLVCPPTHIHFYAHQFLVNSTVEIGAFAKKFPNFHHRHSETMKFFQFHTDNNNSNSTITNPCWLTFLEQMFPKLNSRIHNFNQLISLHLSWLLYNFKFDQFQV